MKNVLIFILIVAVAVLLWMLIKKPESEQVKQNTAGTVELEAQELSRKVDSSGLEHVIYKESEPITKLIEVTVEDKEKVDSLMDVLGLKDRQLKSITNAYGQVSAENVQLKKKPADTAYVMSDNYLHLSFTPKSDTLALSDFRYNFDFQSVSYDPRKPIQKIFNWKDVTYTDIWSKDKRATIRGYEKLTIAKPESTFGYSVNASSMYFPHTNDAGFGGKINFRIKRINASGSYLYFPSSREWYPVFGVDIDLMGKK